MSIRKYIYIQPLWDGPDYKKDKQFDMNEIVEPLVHMI